MKSVLKPWKDDEGGDIYRIEFAFVVHDPDSAWDLQRLWGDTSTTFTTHPDCRLRAWTQELLGQDLPTNFRLDTDTLVGLSCRMIVGAREYEKDGEKKTRNFVKDVLRPRDGFVPVQSSDDDEPPF